VNQCLGADGKVPKTDWHSRQRWPLQPFLGAAGVNYHMGLAFNELKDSSPDEVGWRAEKAFPSCSAGKRSIR
jgi:hypothetical protein